MGASKAKQTTGLTKAGLMPVLITLGRRVGWLGIGLMVGLSSCKGACQGICLSMRDYAEDCGFTVSDEEVDACLADQKGLEREDNQTCRQFGNRVRDEWTCEELEAYWGSPTGGA